ncbi:Mps3p PWA37_000403 [Arxiozyma heterogenica]|uniref:Mps3p n=1 Tax=Arxiozyma heterogenica TaxID=278026 RepID=UPI002EFFB77E
MSNNEVPLFNSARNSISNGHMISNNISNNNSNNSNNNSDKSKSRDMIKEKYKDLLMERMRMNPSISTKDNDNKDYQIDENDLKYNDLDYLDDTDDDSDYDYSYTNNYKRNKSDVNVSDTSDNDITLDEDNDEYVSGDYDLDESYDYDYEYDQRNPQHKYKYNNNDDDNDDDDDDDNNNNNTLISNKSFFHLKFIFISFLLFSGIVYFIRIGGSYNNDLYSSPVKTTGSITNIQKQINHLYNELNVRDKKWNNEFDDKLRIVISQFEKNIRKLLPNNNFINNFQNELNLINSKINSLQDSFYNNNSNHNRDSNFKILQNFTYLQNEILNELNHSLPLEIPVMINNSSSIMIIPELHTYITKLLSNLIQNSNLTNVPSPNLNDLKLKYDLNNYIKEILTNEFQYIDKDFLLSELNHNLKINKLEILNELKDNIKMEWNKYAYNQNNNNNNNRNNFPERYSTVLLKRLINQIYDTNQHQWGNDLDFMTFAQGTRLLKSLTSNNSPVGNGITSMQLLSDTKLDSMSTYWQSEPDSNGQVTIGIRFKQPIYLTKISYLHGRFTNNLHMMNSAPRKISIYVKLMQNIDTINLQKIASRNNEGDLFARDKSFIKIQTYEYDIFNKKIKQNFLLPSWFIKFKPLVKSMIFEINSNYGNKKYVSLKKFIINGVTETDLNILKSKSFPTQNHKDDESSSPEYHFDSSFERIQQQQQQLKESNIQKESAERSYKSKNNQRDTNMKKVPSFGEDELV